MTSSLNKYQTAWNTGWIGDGHRNNQESACPRRLCGIPETSKLELQQQSTTNTKSTFSAMIVTEVCFSYNAVELFSSIKTIRTEVDTKIFFHNGKSKPPKTRNRNQCGQLTNNGLCFTYKRAVCRKNLPGGNSNPNFCNRFFYIKKPNWPSFLES